jgi:hypothetical protein
LEGEDVSYPPFPRQQLGDFDEMIYIGGGLRPFAALIAVFVRSKVQGLQYSRDGGGSVHSSPFSVT